MKIEFLQTLQNFFLQDKIDTEEAKNVVFRLFREAEDLKLSPEDQSAISELFAQKLENFGLFFRYLNTPEYVSTSQHGTTHRERYNEFINTQTKNVTIDDVRKEIVGEDQTNPQSQAVETPSSASNTKKVCRKCSN